MIFQRYKLKANHNLISGLQLVGLTVDDISKIQIESKSQLPNIEHHEIVTVDDISKIQIESKSQQPRCINELCLTVDDISKIQIESKSQPNEVRNLAEKDC